MRGKAHVGPRVAYDHGLVYMFSRCILHAVNLHYDTPVVSYRSGKKSCHTIDKALKEEEKEITPCPNPKGKRKKGWMQRPPHKNCWYSYCRKTGDICKSSGSEKNQRFESLHCREDVRTTSKAIDLFTNWAMNTPYAETVTVTHNICNWNMNQSSLKGSAKLTVIITHVEHRSTVVKILIQLLMYLFLRLTLNNLPLQTPQTWRIDNSDWRKTDLWPSPFLPKVDTVSFLLTFWRPNPAFQVRASNWQKSQLIAVSALFVLRTYHNRVGRRHQPYNGSDSGNVLLKGPSKQGRILIWIQARESHLDLPLSRNRYTERGQMRPPLSTESK